MSAQTQQVRILGTADEQWADGRDYRARYVSSASEQDGYYIVRLAAGAHELVCSCQAAQYGKVCKHRQLVHDVLAVEKAAAPTTPRQPKPSRPRTVSFDGRGGRGSKCATCGKAFTVGEDITLIDGKAFHVDCVQRSSAPGATAPRQTGNKFSILK